MNKTSLLSVMAAFVMAGCASNAPQSSSSPAPTKPSTTPDSGPKAEAPRKPDAGTRFAALRIGMDMNDVQDVMGRAPDRLHTFESGKRWIPFYFGNDARRMQVLYKGEGCLVFTGGNIWGGAAGDLLEVQADPAGACYQP